MNNAFCDGTRTRRYGVPAPFQFQTNFVENQLKERGLSAGTGHAYTGTFLFPKNHCMRRPFALISVNAKNVRRSASAK